MNRWQETAWWSAQAAAPGTTEILIYDRIGEGLFEEGLSAKHLAGLLAAVTTPRITVRLNSPGGSVFDGLAIYNALRDHPAQVDVKIDGLAASIASVIACAGDTVEMAENALFMLHNPFTGAAGDAAALRSAATMLDRVRDSMIAAYETRTTLGRDDIVAAMDAETWYSAAEAVEHGFADRTTAASPAAASLIPATWFTRTPGRNTAMDPEIEGQTSLPVPAEPQAAAPDLTGMQRTVDDLVARVNRMGDTAQASSLSRFESFGHFVQAAYRDADVMAALADQITTNNPGVMQDGWVREVKGIVDKGRPFIQALGGAGSLPASGLTVNWPYYDGNLAAVFAAQTAQKTDVNSVRVDIKRGTGNVATIAAGSDVALQLIERSDPAYLDQLMRVYMAAYAYATNLAAVLGAEAAGTGTVTAGTADGDFFTAVVEANQKVYDATGMPADVVAVKASEWAKLAGATNDLGQPLYPRGAVYNVAGTSAGSRAVGIEIDGVPTIPVPGLTTLAVATNRAAFTFLEDGPKTLDETVVSRLGRDVAVYGYQFPAPYVPSGIVKIGAGVATARTAKS